MLRRREILRLYIDDIIVVIAADRRYCSIAQRLFDLALVSTRLVLMSIIVALELIGITLALIGLILALIGLALALIGLALALIGLASLVSFAQKPARAYTDGDFLSL